jgi:release factor glutamine methyltransferase
MERNVLEHEPELALFVPDDDPLLFYRAIARYAAKTLKPDGALYFEINPLYVNEMQQMLSEEGFSHIEVRNDQFGKQRFTKSWL